MSTFLGVAFIDRASCGPRLYCTRKGKTSSCATVYRRGAKEADQQISELVRIIDAVKGDTNKHMAHEEQEVLPLLEAHLCAAEQRAMVWRTLRAMPLRLLERVMPWVAGTA